MIVLEQKAPFPGFSRTQVFAQARMPRPRWERRRQTTSLKVLLLASLEKEPLSNFDISLTNLDNPSIRCCCSRLSLSDAAAQAAKGYWLPYCPPPRTPALPCPTGSFWAFPQLAHWRVALCPTKEPKNNWTELGVQLFFTFFQHKPKNTVHLTICMLGNDPWKTTPFSGHFSKLFL